MKQTGATDWVSEQRGIALLRLTSTIALVTAVLFSLGASSFLHATQGRDFHLVTVSKLLESAAR